MQSKAFTLQAEWTKKAEAIRKSIRGDMEVFGYDREVDEAIKKQLGQAPDSRQEAQTVQDKMNAHLQKLTAQNGQDPTYRALAFELGNVPNPLKPDVKAYQHLVVDGPDAANLTSTLIQQTVYQNQNSRVLQYYPEKDITNDLGNFLYHWKNKTLQAVKSAVAQGDTSQVLDLDA